MSGAVRQGVLSNGWTVDWLSLREVGCFGLVCAEIMAHVTRQQSRPEVCNIQRLTARGLISMCSVFCEIHPTANPSLSKIGDDAPAPDLRYGFMKLDRPN